MSANRPQSSPVASLVVLLQDLSFCFRQLRKSPGFAVVVIGSLAFGIGASVAVFSVVRAVLLDPYPYKDAKRMVHVELAEKANDRQTLLSVTAPEYQQLLRLHSVDDIFLSDTRMQALTGDALPVSIATGYYTPNLFTYMGVPPFLGRQFTAADVSGGSASPVAVLSYLFWKKQYGGRLDIVGKTVEIDHTPYTVIGVASPRFTWNDSNVYLPASFPADPHHYLGAFLKLKPDVPFTVAAAELQPLVDTFAKADPSGFPQGSKVAIKTLNEEVLHGFEAPLLVLFAAVLLLPLIGCANVSILMLARGTARQHEFAVRTSIGASRSRIIRQVLTESVMLAFLGTGLGVLLAYRGVDLLAAHLPQNSFPNEAVIHVNATVLLFAVGMALLTGLVFGGSPAWQMSRPDVGAMMQGSSVKLAGSVRGGKTHRALIAGQVALTMLLLAGAGAAARAFLTLYHTPMGFDPDRLFYMNVSLPKGTALQWESLRTREEVVRQAVESAPGVKSASFSTTGWVPPFASYNVPVDVASKPALTNAKADLALVSYNMFSTLRAPLLAGRFFTLEEDHRAAHVALVNRTFVHQYLSAADAVGQSIRSSGLKLSNPNLAFTPNADGWMEVIGVVDDVRNNGLDKPVQPAIYLPQSIVLGRGMTLVVRAAGEPALAMRAAGESLHRADGDAYIIDQHDFAWLLENQGWGRERFLASLFALFAVLALALSAAGIYSVVSYTVSQRTREFGVRMALGSKRLGIVGLVLRSSVVAVGVGALTGMALSLALSKVLATSPNARVQDPLMLFAVSLLLLGITALATFYPAWRAASIDPVRAIRAE